MAVSDDLKVYDADLEAPFTWLVAGPSGSGKTVHVVKGLRTHVNPRVEHTYWFYGVWSAMYDQMSKELPITFTKGLPDSNFPNTLDTSKNLVIVFDDLMQEVTKASAMVSSYFTRGSHHLNVSVVLIVQNLFAKNLREIRLNTRYLSLFSIPNDLKSVKAFASQITDSPTAAQNFLAVYKDATSMPFEPLFIDFRGGEDMKFRSKVFEFDHQYVYTI